MLIPDIEDDVVARLEARAAGNGRSLNDEVLAILREGLRRDGDPSGSEA